jgi:TonB family protein
MSYAIELVLRSSCVLATGWAICWLLRKQPAAFRHWLLAITVALAAALPVINVALPAVELPAMGWTKEIKPAPTVEGEADTTVTFAGPVDAVVRPSPSFDWATFAYRVWIAGVIASAGLLACAAIWLMWLGRRAEIAGPNWQDTADDVSAELGIRRPVRILITSHPAMLVTWGAIAPVILLPADAGAWPDDRIRVVLAHELAHVARRDWLIQLCAEAARAINWFNPLFWIACARLRRDSEHACDDIVLDLGIQGTSYAEHLVALARTFSVHGRTWLPAPSIARPSTLERRVRAMLNPQVDRRPVSRSRKAVLAAIMFAAALPIAAASQGKAAPAGTITDPSGLPLPDAVVRLNPVDGEGVFETRSDAAGAFQFPEVPTGEYMLSARYPGFSSVRQRIPINGTVTIKLQLQVGTLRETVSVRGGSGKDAGPKESRRTVTASYAAPSCGSTTVGGNLKPPMKVRDVRPRFKQSWTDANVEGDVLLQARIGTDGRVQHVEVVSPGNPELEDEAIAAVSQWEFSPTYLNCEAVEVRMFVTVSFKIER